MKNCKCVREKKRQRGEKEKNSNKYKNRELEITMRFKLIFSGFINRISEREKDN